MSLSSSFILKTSFLKFCMLHYLNHYGLELLRNNSIKPYIKPKRKYIIDENCFFELKYFFKT